VQYLLNAFLQRNFGVSVPLAFYSSAELSDLRTRYLGGRIEINLRGSTYFWLVEGFREKKWSESLHDRVAVVLCHELTHLTMGAGSDTHNYEFGYKMFQTYEKAFLNSRLGSVELVQEIFSETLRQPIPK
jgi:hypothetical protein